MRFQKYTCTLTININTQGEQTHAALAKGQVTLCPTSQNSTKSSQSRHLGGNNNSFNFALFSMEDDSVSLLRRHGNRKIALKSQTHESKYTLIYIIQHE